MRLTFKGLLVCFGLLAQSHPGAPQTIDRVRFAQAPVLMVWSDSDEPLIGDRIELQPSTVAVETLDFPGAGQLEPIQAVNQTAARLQTFRLASNAGFSINAVAHSFQETSLAPITVHIRYPGTHADDRLIQFAQTNLSLRDLGSSQELLRVQHKTADTPGTPLNQSVEIEIDWGALPEGEVAVTLQAISE